MTELRKNEMENRMQKELAIAYVKDYCNRNQLSIEKLRGEMFQLSYDQCGFFHQSDVVPDGLLNDMETLPKATLVIRYQNGALLIEQTEYTKECLSLDLR